MLVFSLGFHYSRGFHSRENPEHCGNSCCTDSGAGPSQMPRGTMHSGPARSVGWKSASATVGLARNVARLHEESCACAEWAGQQCLWKTGRHKLRQLPISFSLYLNLDPLFFSSYFFILFPLLFYVDECLAWMFMHHMCAC